MSRVIFLILLLFSQITFAKNNIDTDPYQFQIQKTGKGGPVIIFQSDLGDDYSVWDKVTPELAKTNTVFLYNRLNIGKSKHTEIYQTKLTAEDIIYNLHDLLERQSILGPYILVGHGMGAVYQQLYARRFPNEVSALILIDSAVPTAPLSVITKDQAAYTEAQGRKQSFAQLQQAPSLASDIPVIIISAGKFPSAFTEQEKSFNKNWPKWQNDLAKQIQQSDHITIEQSGHYIQREAPSVIIKQLQEATSFD